MKVGLLTIVFSVLCSTALYSQQPRFSDTVICRNHKTDFETHALFQSEEIIYQMSRDYIIPVSKKELIDNYIREKERKKYACNYKRYEDISYRVKEKAEIDSLYLDSIFAVLVPYNPQMTGRAISLSLFFAEELSLSSDIVKRLTEKAVEFARLLYKIPCAYPASEEMVTLKQELTYNQLKNLLEEKNSTEAKVNANRAWDNLTQAGLSDELDSISDVGRAYLYYRTELCLKDFFVDNKELLENNLADLYKNKPRIIRMNDALWQKKQVQKKYEKQVSSEYSW